MSVNQTLLDKYISHVLQLDKLARGQSNKIVRLLNSADDELVEKIATRLVKIEERGYDLGPASTKRLQDMQADLKDLNDAIYKRVHTTLRDELGDLAQYEAKWAGQTISAALPINFKSNIPSATYLKTLVDQSPIDGHLLSSWTDHMSLARQGRVNQAIRLGLVQGETTDQIVRRVAGSKAANYSDGVLNISRQSAQTLVLTSSATVASNARSEVYQRNSNVIKEVRWTATLDTRTSSICQSRDGTAYKIDEAHPKPPAHPRCRSVLVPMTKSFRELGLDKDEVSDGQRASMDGQVPGKTSFGDWIKNQAPERQDEVFGKQRAELFRAGKVDFKDLFAQSGEYKTLDELRRAEGIVPDAPEPEVEVAAEADQPFSPIDRTVTAETIPVQRRLDVQKALTKQLSENAGDLRYLSKPEFRGVTVDHFGKAVFPTGFSDQSVSMLSAMMPDLDAMADAFSIPRLRGMRQTTSAIGNMGDGVLGLNPSYFNGYASKIGNAEGALVQEIEAKRDALQAKMEVVKAKLTDVRAARVAMTEKNEQFYELFVQESELIKEYNALIKPFNKLAKEVTTAKRSTKESVSEWKPGDDISKRPFNTVEYFTGIDRARNVLYHEFGHHVHQMRDKKGPRGRNNIPPIEVELDQIFYRKFRGVTDAHRKASDAQASSYSKTNSKEWFAENFSLYMMGRHDLVDDDVKGLIERLLNDKTR